MASPHICPRCGERVTPFAAGCALCGTDLDPRDTLLRDFGHDPARLAAEVERTLRHEIAHHLGYREGGVAGLGL
jgi:predicted amidophosphoribosyltransferase